MFPTYQSFRVLFTTPFRIKRHKRGTSSSVWICIQNSRTKQIIPIGHVIEYPTMHYFINPRHTQSMIAYIMIFTEYFCTFQWKIHCGNFVNILYSCIRTSCIRRQRRVVYTYSSLRSSFSLLMMFSSSSRALRESSYISCTSFICSSKKSATYITQLLYLDILYMVHLCRYFLVIAKVCSIYFYEGCLPLDQFSDSVTFIVQQVVAQT